MEQVTKLLPLLIPILLIQLALIAVALWDLAHRSRTRGPKIVWVFVIILVNFIGPILYFVVGREE